MQGRILQLPLNCMAQDQELATLRERASAALRKALCGVCSSEAPHLNFNFFDLRVSFCRSKSSALLKFRAWPGPLGKIHCGARRSFDTDSFGEGSWRRSEQPGMQLSTTSRACRNSAGLGTFRFQACSGPLSIDAHDSLIVFPRALVFTRRMVEELRQEALDRPSEAARLPGSGHVRVETYWSGFPVVLIVAQTFSTDRQFGSNVCASTGR